MEDQAVWYIYKRASDGCRFQLFFDCSDCSIANDMFNDNDGFRIT